MSETRLLVISDTHGSMHHFLPAVPLDQVDWILFAGDGYDEAMATFAKYGVAERVHAVAGNCDGRPALADAEITLAGWPIWITHGDRWDVKHGYDPITREARRRGVRLVVFGHSHRAHYEERDGIHLFNPGSPLEPRGGTQASLGWITLNAERGQFDHLLLD
ncbi:MAG: YfcE family phosphodiesterase [Candidatus Sericytochromatia bacterium]|nr:YfcE family phosphodiesterase [Candidatus Sericytochromatia bacterium]